MEQNNCSSDGEGVLCMINEPNTYTCLLRCTPGQTQTSASSGTCDECDLGYFGGRLATDYCSSVHFALLVYAKHCSLHPFPLPQVKLMDFVVLYPFFGAFYLQITRLFSNFIYCLSHSATLSHQMIASKSSELAVRRLRQTSTI